MSNYVNEFSSAFAILALVVGTWVIVRRRSRLVRRSVAVALVVVVAGGLLLLRTGAGDIQAVEDLDRAVGHGRPVMLELYSNW